MQLNEKSPSISIARKLRRFRRQSKMTQQMFASQLGISVSYLSCIERGQRGISQNISIKLHNLFGFSYHELIEGCHQDDDLVPFQPVLYYANITKESNSYFDYQKALEQLISQCSKQELKTCYILCTAFLSSIEPSLNPDTEPSGSGSTSPNEADTPFRTN